jgi:L-seryl-tRNA(Ser) seleniumtransferase
MSHTTDERRRLPSVNVLLDEPEVRGLLQQAPRRVVVAAVRAAVQAARAAPSAVPTSPGAWADAVRAELRALARPSLRRVLKGTGVVVHTNIGSAPLSASALAAIGEVAAGFSNLEYDIENGARGSRYVHSTSLLRELTGAEDALVVNNGAAALLLALNTRADGREAIVSRGELIEIGGSFRIPDIMAKSGARLVEVGTTNRTHLDDYRHAITAATGALVKVHRSNFAIAGFVADVSPRDAASLAREHDVPLLHDLGSGLLISLDAFGLRGEPTAGEALRDGASLVTMSGDKLLGGPQAGLVLGRADLIARMRANPLTRALRVDKLTLAALETTLASYRDPQQALERIPVLAQLTATIDTLRVRAERIRDDLQIDVEIVDTGASVGGGAFPTARIPSVALALGGSATHLEHALRHGEPPVIARIAADRVLVDLRTIDPRDDGDLTGCIVAAYDRLAAAGSA